MTIYRRLLFLIGLSILITIFFILRSNNSIKTTRLWRNAPQMIGLGDLMEGEDEEQILSPPQPPQDPTSFQPALGKSAISKDPSPFTFRPGTAKPHGSTYTKAVVMGRVMSENITWLDTADLAPNISKYIYIVDKPSSPTLTVPKNKGHEAMVYLTYIIDHYDTLPDVSIFVHAHQHAWHNNEMLNHDAIETIQRLSAERVTREGYMNLRCHWKPGCPEYIHPGVVRVDKNKPEEGEVASAWSVMFPGEKIPEVMGVQCCAQFAVSRERIRSTPAARYRLYRDWLLKTKLRDSISGRVFEYLWHKIFTGQSTFCPDMRVCYCDGYGVCFEDEKEFDYWFEMKWKKRRLENKLEEWDELVRKLNDQKEKWRFGRKGIEGLEELDLEVPVVDRDVDLKKEIEKYKVLLEERRLRALKAGTDPRVRASVAGREWKEGDGY